MGRRRVRAGLGAAAVMMVAWTGCKGQGAAPAPSAASLDVQCERLGKICGDTFKHVESFIAACKLAAKPQVARGCTSAAIAAYDCFEQDICSHGDKVWALADVDVLAERKNKCVAERAALKTCTEATK